MTFDTCVVPQANQQCCQHRNKAWLRHYSDAMFHIKIELHNNEKSSLDYTGPKKSYQWRKFNHKQNVKLLKKLHRMRATGDFKVFVSKCCVLHVQCLKGNMRGNTHSLKYSFSKVLIQWSTHSVKNLFSEVLIQWSYHSVKYSFSEVLFQRSTHSVKYLLR